MQMHNLHKWSHDPLSQRLVTPVPGVGKEVGSGVSPHALGPAPLLRSQSRRGGRSFKNGREVGNGRGALERTITAAGQGHV